MGILGKSKLFTVNRQLSWLLVLTSLINYVSGYAQTVLNIQNRFLLLGHQVFGVFFILLTLIHVLLSVFVLRYPWVQSVRRILSGEANFLYKLKLAQRLTGLMIIAPSFLIALSGLDWFKVGTGYLLPFSSHVRFDFILSLVIIAHTAIGLKFALIRRRRIKPMVKVQHSPARREAIAIIGGTILSIVALSYLDKVPRIGSIRDKISGVLPPNQYEVDALRPLHVGQVPKFDEDRWDLVVDGLVENPIRLTYQEFLKLPIATSFSDFHCVTGWTKFNNKWEGVRFRTLINKVKPKNAVKYATIECENDYTTSLPLEELEYDDVILAYRLDDNILPSLYGGPLRLVVPQKYAYKSAKWVRRIKFTEEQELGYWEQRGYSNTADPFANDRYSKINN
jgi:hypothetical protein